MSNPSTYQFLMRWTHADTDEWPPTTGPSTSSWLSTWGSTNSTRLSFHGFVFFLFLCFRRDLVFLFLFVLALFFGLDLALVAFVLDMTQLVTFLCWFDLTIEDGAFGFIVIAFTILRSQLNFLESILLRLFLRCVKAYPGWCQYHYFLFSQVTISRLVQATFQQYRAYRATIKICLSKSD